MPAPVKVDQMASGVASLSAATITIATGLPSVSSVTVSLQDDPVAGTAAVTAQPAATPGSITIKGWNSTLVAVATTFPKNVTWVAFA